MQGGGKGGGKGAHTLFLLSLALVVRAPVDACFEDLVLALELILKLVLKLAGLVLVDVHGAVAILDGLGQALVGLCGSLGHGG